MKIDTSTKLKTFKLANPTILASGILGLDVPTLERVAQAGAGALTIKSLTVKPRKGHNNPIVVQASEQSFMNAVGYANKGIDKGIEEFKKWKNETPLIGSIVANKDNEFLQLVEKIQQTPIKALEVALSCPHTPGYGLMAGQGTPEAVAHITKLVRKKIKLPLIIKLAPMVEPVSEIAKAAEAEGADIINMGNTLGPGLKIDVTSKEPILDFEFGGLSGPAIRPIMIRSIYDLYASVDLPLIATGGITTGEDAVEAILAGAAAVGIGTAIYYRGIDVFDKVTEEIKDWMKENNYTKLVEFRGIAHG